MTELTHHFADLSQLRMHYVTAGKGEPVVLLHGWPQTWYAWRDVIPLLAKNYFVVAPDLRGLGDSSRPTSGYDKRTIATDVHELATQALGLPAFNLVGHDWGGPVAFAGGRREYCRRRPRLFPCLFQRASRHAAERFPEGG